MTQPKNTIAYQSHQRFFSYRSVVDSSLPTDDNRISSDTTNTSFMVLIRLSKSAMVIFTLIPVGNSNRLPYRSSIIQIIALLNHFLAIRSCIARRNSALLLCILYPRIRRQAYINSKKKKRKNYNTPARDAANDETSKAAVSRVLCIEI